MAEMTALPISIIFTESVARFVLVWPAIEIGYLLYGMKTLQQLDFGTEVV